MRSRRYPADTTDDEWALIEPLLPVAACFTPRGGRPEVHLRRDIVDAIRFLVDSGCKWRSLPGDFPPFQTVHGFFARWTRAGVFNRIRDALRCLVRRQMGKPPRAVAAVIDSQSVKAADTVSRAGRGYDAGKRINGRKRHIVVDTQGLLLFVMITPASVHDGRAGREVLFRLRLMHPQRTVVWADPAYGGTRITWARTMLRLTVRTVSRPAGTNGFILLPRRWVAERTLAWMMHARPLVRDYERLPQHAEAMVTLAALTLMTRRLTRAPIHPNAAAPRPARPAVAW
ncbi:IS5 family transposase [Streptomyces yaizuensis]|uniref:IS5 family transposase n=1 Tax=Streptomyces yaizuensis TaxID=2989713 RepID=A0ABQ5NZ05_9ACTN|nr:IS5 family transposase [Streptomyces sp. YSPA8]